MRFNGHISLLIRLVLFGGKQTANCNSLHLVNKGPQIPSQKIYGVLKLAHLCKILIYVFRKEMWDTYGEMLTLKHLQTAD